MASFDKTPPSVDGSEKRTLGEGVFRKCEGCAEAILAEEFVRNHEVCPACGQHHPLRAEVWVELLLDPGSWEEHDADLTPGDPLSFTDTKPYGERLIETWKATGRRDAILCGQGRIHERPIQLGCFAYDFMGGSMGSVVGEKITRMMERGLARNEPVVLLCSSGGARMQEGALSLMQMAKTVGALAKLREATIPFISVLLHPTTGGVAASFALLGDINIAEPGALIGFAGPRVIENTIGQTLPKGFQRSEHLLDHGMLDIIAERPRMRATIAHALGHLVG